MKDRPILFSAPMVRALLDGNKTQTRRLVKGWPLEWLESANFTPEYLALPENNACPYGQPGDRLIVRETWQYADWTEDGYPWIAYQADGVRHLCDRIPSEEWSEKLRDIWAGLSDEKNFAIDNRAADRRWRPSIHMPRWASRITLEVTGVRVERLQDISANDARAEGCPDKYVEDAEQASKDLMSLLWYHDLWEQINGSGSWDANPWVWVVEFKVVKP